jgi:DNA-binding response OmpR family regulator
MERMLVIEDDRSLYKPLRHVFEADGYSLDFVEDGQAGIEAFRKALPALVLLDLKLPKMHGREVCRQIRDEAPGVPLIVLSASTDEMDKVLMLELGADDYVTKPFSPRELLARVHSVRRRLQDRRASDRQVFGSIEVDFAKMVLTRDGAEIAMTPQEYKILKYFLANPDRVISRDELLNQVWGFNCYPSTRTVDNHLVKLRQKLEDDPANPRHFKTVHGAGYKFVP